MKIQKKIAALSISAAIVILGLFFISCDRKTKIEDNMVLVEGSDFVMGNDSIELPWGFFSHQAHNTSVSSFYISPFEVTQKDFEEVMGYNPSYYQGTASNKMATEGEDASLRPVEKVTWYEAIVYCNKLSEKMGLVPVYLKICESIESEVPEEKKSSKNKTKSEFPENATSDTSLWGECPKEKNHSDWDNIIWDKKANGYRLPTEAEWEFSAIGGKLSNGLTSAGCNYDDPIFDTFSWNRVTSNGITHQVGLLTPNELGLYDMGGNVWEWCWDFFADDYYTTEEACVKNPDGPAVGESKCLRGACWDDDGVETANIVRGANSAFIPSRRGGFRIVRNAK